MNTSFATRFSEYWKTLQKELLPMQAADLEGITPMLERIIRVLEWVRIEEHVSKGQAGGVRKPNAQIWPVPFVPRRCWGWNAPRN